MGRHLGPYSVVPAMSGYRNVSTLERIVSHSEKAVCLRGSGTGSCYCPVKYRDIVGKYGVRLPSAETAPDWPGVIANAGTTGVSPIAAWIAGLDNDTFRGGDILNVKTRTAQIAVRMEHS